jgi:hypothetical protein
MQLLLPKLAEYGIASLAIGALTVVYLRVFTGLTAAWSAEMRADREQRARDASAMLKKVDHVGDRVDGLHDKLDRLTSL